MVYELATITSVDTNPHPIVAARTAACWVQLVADPANASPVNFGGTQLATGRGIPIPKGAGQMFPPVGDLNFYDLSTIKYQFQSGAGDKLYVVYARR